MKRDKKWKEHYSTSLPQMEATAFAIELLMPEKVIEKEIKDNYTLHHQIFDREKALKELPDKYGVEKQLIIKRLETMGYGTN